MSIAIVKSIMSCTTAFYVLLFLVFTSGIEWRHLKEALKYPSSEVDTVDPRNVHSFFKIKIKYDIKDGFYNLPRSLNEIGKGEENEYVLVTKDEELNVDIYSYPNDPRVCLLFDTHGNIAGVRVSFLIEDITKKAEENNLTFPYKFENSAAFTYAKYWEKELFHTTVLFVSPEHLYSGGRTETNNVIAERVYIRDDKKWIEISRNECEVEKQGFVKQTCFFGMGMHYFYKLDKDTKCEDVFPYFALYDHGELSGFGLVAFGDHTHQPNGRKWFEKTSVFVSKMITSNGPDCRESWMENYGVTTLHFFFKEYPLSTLCYISGNSRNKCGN